MVNESRVTVLCIIVWDKTKARHNWKAIKLEQVEITSTPLPDFDHIPF
ncbi:hypothetical protein [Photobacterium damselae]